jgi:hypothetical protein
MGSPERPTRRQLRRLQAASELTERSLELHRDHESGDAAFTVSLLAESVAAVHVGR